MKRPVKSLRSLSFADRVAIVSFAVGVVVVILGIALIMESRSVSGVGFGDIAVLGIVVWDEVQLATGIILAMVGTAASSASFTYAALKRKQKGV